MNTLGLDEAGRGPVLGPMVVAGIVIPEKKEKIIERMGVKDSKRITPKRRAVLYRKLTRMFDYETVEISAKDIDLLRAKGVNLNQIEKLAMMRIIAKLKADTIIIDSLDIKEGRLEEEMQNFVGEGSKVIAEHKADDKYIVVGAASIIAKTKRDEIINQINKEYIRSTGNKDGIGSGYPSDPKTKNFLKNYKYDEMPDFVRRSWGTVQRIKEAEEAEKSL
ncbi:ribonuclease HII RnhB [Methanobrevibacter ruminantium M1]|uniref:Ribonuclease HII n=1 Tax=Methanobrevibacter ruminantium (strain ATCC 35063 / DSM 1093 / JCM 13430 / OCM 146 / M1) TaxID=634498 RepID=D3DZL0_METRM|nr:ribonuclease HII [Methanobrevibacter ruminantium]ADC47688.1 ribonuclease HII RnhB [Methanobrevibacter ruminantium M1]